MFLVELLTIESLTETPLGNNISRRLFRTTRTLPSSIAPSKRLQSHRLLLFGPYPLLIKSFPLHSALLCARARYPLRRQQCALDTLQKDLVMQACPRGAAEWHRKIGEIGILRGPLEGLTGTH